MIAEGKTKDQPVLDQERTTETQQSIASIVHLLRVARYAFLAMGAAFLVWEAFELFWLGEGVTFVAVIEVALVSVLGPVLVWVTSKWAEALSREVGQSHEELFHQITERRRAEVKLQENQKQLQLLTSEMSLVEERERRRIAANLHDRIVQTLGLSRIKLGALRESLSSTEHSALLHETQKLIDQTIQDSRSLIFDLSPPVLYELGLEPAVEWLAEKIQDEYGLTCKVQNDEQPQSLGEDTKVVLFQAVRELLVNVGKHANAREAKVTFRRKGNRMQISVEDDGVGFDTTTIGTHRSKTGGFGLFSIRERLNLLGGHLEIESVPGHGTRVVLTGLLSFQKVGVV